VRDCLIAAQLRVTPAALVRLLSISGHQSDFILTAANGSTAVRVALAITTVPDSELEIGTKGALLDWSKGVLSYRGNRVTLTRLELRLLVALLELAPKPATKDYLIEMLWEANGPRRVKLRTALPVWIHTLRRRLAFLGLPDAIRTERREGYSLTL